MRRALLLILFQNVVAEEISSCNNVVNKQKEGTLCSFLDILKGEQWLAEAQPCLDFTLEMLHGVRNSTLWATWIWDAMQRPTGVLYGSQYQLGNFDQCVKPPWLDSHPHLRTQYCLADILLTDVVPNRSRSIVDPNGPAELFMNIPSSFGRHLNLVRWGVCFSAKCSPQAITRLVQLMLQTQHLVQAGVSPIKIHSCQLSEFTNEYGFGNKLFVLILLLLSSAVLLSTYFIDHLKADTLPNKLARSFYLKRNWSTLIRTSEDDIHVLNGLRFNSSVIIVLLHHLGYNIYNSNINGLDIDKASSTEPLSILLHLDVVVDTFFVMSGLLLVRSIVRHQQLGKGSLLRLLWSRYVRLIGVQATMVFYFACVFSHSAGGPLWPYFGKDEVEDCSNNWWANILMINNYVNTSKMCHMVSWNNSCDYQLAIMGIVLYHIYQKRKKVGLRCFTVVFLITLIAPGVVTYWKKLPAIMAFNAENARNLKSNPVFQSTYIQSHHRAGAYLLGMVLGHIMTVYKLADYRKFIPTRWSVLGALASLFVMENVLSIATMLVLNDYSPWAVAVYVSVNRIIWAFAICCLIVVCEYGTVPIIGDYLRLQFAGPMGRLSYGVYMVHMTFIYRIVYSARAPLTSDLLSLTIGGFGVVCISFFVSCVLWHLIEAPLVNISNILLGAMLDKKIPNNNLNNGVVQTTKKVVETDSTATINKFESVRKNEGHEHTNDIYNNGLHYCDIKSKYSGSNIAHDKDN